MCLPAAQKERQSAFSLVISWRDYFLGRSIQLPLMPTAESPTLQRALSFVGQHAEAEPTTAYLSDEHTRDGGTEMAWNHGG